MKRALLGALAGAGLVLATVGAVDRQSAVFAQRPVAPFGSGSIDELIALPGPASEKGQLLTIIDPRQRAMGVYRIDPVDGKIGLQSVRNIHWDLQMTYYNCESPLPQEIRSGLEQLR